MSKWLQFVLQPRPEGKKTDTWFVQSNANGGVLGVIRWYGPFRKYTFEPRPNTVYDADCLADIQGQLNNLMRERKVEQQNEKQKGI